MNLEYGRWLLHDVGGTFVAVNVAGYRLYSTTAPSVGRRESRLDTVRPRCSAPRVQPAWTVPPGILRKDIAPSQRRDPTTIERKGLRVFDAGGNEAPASAVDWAGAGRVLITYWTAWVASDGVLHLRSDVHGRDEKVLQGLRSGFRFISGVPA